MIARRRTARYVATLLSAGIFGTVVTGSPSAARADPTSPAGRPFDVVYEPSSAPCPDRAAFVSAIRARTARSQLAQTSDLNGAVTFRVAIDVGPTSSSGQLHVRETDGSEQRRSVTSRTCREVASALALVAALVLEPDAASERSEERVEEESQPAPPEPPMIPTAAPLAAPAPANRARDRPAEPARDARTPWSFALGPELGVMSGIGPDVAPMAGLSFDAMPRTRRVFAPSFHLSAAFAGTGEDLSRGSTTYRWFGATLRMCPVQALFAGARVRVAPCAGMQAGVHHGTSSGVSAPSSHTELWLAPTGGASISWAASSAFAVELQGGALFPLRRTRFFLAPDTTLYEVPAIGGTATLGLLIRFM
jgi:hypothetical protein